MSLFVTRSTLVLAACLTVSGCASLGNSATDSTESKLSPEELAQNYIRDGDRYYAESRLDKALVQYMLALEQDEKNADTFFKVGTIHRSQNNLELAEQSYRQSLRLSSEHIGSREGIGLVSLRKENYQYAELMLESVLELDENRFEAMNALGILHDLQEQYAVAQQYYRDALETFPNSAKLLNNLGYSYYLQRRWQDAENYFKQAVGYRPNYSQGWSNLALAYMQQGRIDDARLAFEKTVDTHQALNNMGYFEYLRNNSDEARKNFQEATKSSPSYYAVAQQNLASIEGKKNDRLKSADADTTANLTLIDPSTVPSDTSSVSIKIVEASSERPIVKKSTTAKNYSDGITAEDIKTTQEKLSLLGYDPGPIDGVIGNKTIKAVKEFQSDFGYFVDGLITKSLISLL